MIREKSTKNEQLIKNWPDQKLNWTRPTKITKNWPDLTKKLVGQLPTPDFSDNEKNRLRAALHRPVSSKRSLLHLYAPNSSPLVSDASGHRHYRDNLQRQSEANLYKISQQPSVRAVDDYWKLSSRAYFSLSKWISRIQRQFLQRFNARPIYWK